MRVKVNNVSLAYGNNTVLADFSAEFNPGKVTALVGPSGSGKSTLLAAMGGFVKPRAGNIQLHENDDHDYSGPALNVRPEYIGWIPQGANALGARTVTDNVMIGVLSSGVNLKTAEKRAHESLELVGMTHRSNALARTLSGGELQRIAFARAFASGRPLILADEPTSSLDAANTDNIVDLLHSLRATATVIVATHDPAIINAVEEEVHLRGEDNA